MGLFDFTKLETAPGETGPFAPSALWSGNPDQYRKRMKAAAINQLDRYQLIVVMTLFETRGGHIGFVGPFAQEAKEVYEQIKASLVQKSSQTRRIAQ